MGRSMSPSVWKCRAASVRTTRCVPRSPPRSTARASSRQPSTPRLPSAASSVPSSQPASTSAPRTMSPLAPDGQSKYAILIRRAGLFPSRGLEAPVELDVEESRPLTRDGAPEGRADVTCLLDPLGPHPQRLRQAHEVDARVVEIHGDVAVDLGGETLHRVRPLLEDAVGRVVQDHER